MIRAGSRVQIGLAWKDWAQFLKSFAVKKVVTNIPPPCGKTHLPPIKGVFQALQFHLDFQGLMQDIEQLSLNNTTQIPEAVPFSIQSYFLISCLLQPYFS